MTNKRSTYATAAAVVLSVATLGFTGAAQAHVDVSVGIGFPGIAIGVPAPVYGASPRQSMGRPRRCITHRLRCW